MVRREDWIEHYCLPYDITFQINNQINFERQNIIQELLEKETTSLKIFNYFIKTYYIPMTTSINTNIFYLPKKLQENLVIPGILNIYYFMNHEKGILNQLRLQLQKEDSKIEIGKLMIKSIPLIQLYGSYFQHFKEKIETFYLLKKKFKKFSNFLKDIQENDLNLEGKSYEDLICLPYQRVCHYELFLEKLNSKTSFFHKDKINLCLAVQDIKKFKGNLNSKMKKSKETDKKSFQDIILV